MAADPIHQPHDKLFKERLGVPSTAAGILKHEIPARISERMGWDRLVLQPGSFIDSQFRQHESDLLFSVPWNDRDCFIYILFEHQVTEDPMLALRLLRYMVRIWESYLKDKPPGSLLPVILPVVLAQNKNVWKLTPQFSCLFDLPAEHSGDLKAFLPDFTFRLIQLAAIPFDAIRGTPEGIMLLRIMKAERSDLLLSDPVWDESLLAQVPGSFFELILRYILNADIDSTAFTDRIKAINQPELQSTAMTLAQQIRQEGLEKGLHDSILEALEIRFGVVPAGVSEAIRAIHDEPRLRELHRAAIQSPSLEDFSRSL